MAKTKKRPKKRPKPKYQFDDSRVTMVGAKTLTGWWKKS